MRTTLDLDRNVLAELRRRSRRERKSMGRVASELLAASLAEDQREREPFRWHSADLGEPRVNLEDKEELRRALDEG